MSLHDNQITLHENIPCVIAGPRQSSSRRDRRNGHPDCRCVLIQIVALHASQWQRLNEEIEELIDQYDEALIESDIPEAWRALDERLAQTKIGRLLRERHEIAEQILDAEEDDEDGEF